MSGTGFIDAPRSAEHFDPFHDPSLADPYPFFAEARAATPVFYSPDLDYWVVTRYHDSRSPCLSSRTPDGGRKQGRPSPSLAVYPAHHRRATCRARLMQMRAMGSLGLAAAVCIDTTYTYLVPSGLDPVVLSVPSLSHPALALRSHHASWA
jgi:hypothetical protein